MDCAKFRQDAFEIAAGTVTPRRKVACHAHAENCDACRALLKDLHSLGAAVRADWDIDQAPSALRQSIRTALSEAREATVEPVTSSVLSMGSDWNGAIVGSGSQTERRHRLIVVPLALAATVMVAIGLWQFTTPDKTTEPIVTVVKHEILNEALRRHVWCSGEEHVFHNDADLVGGLRQVESILTHELGLQVRVPDFVDFGFSLLGARRCRVAGIPVAHALYHSIQGRRLVSLFSMYRIHDLGKQRDDAGIRRYYILDEGPGTTLAWNEGRQTYVISGYVSRSEALAMCESVRYPLPVAGRSVPRSAIAWAVSVQTRTFHLGDMAGFGRFSSKSIRALGKWKDGGNN